MPAPLRKRNDANPFCTLPKRRVRTNFPSARKFLTLFVKLTIGICVGPADTAGFLTGRNQMALESSQPDSDGDVE